MKSVTLFCEYEVSIKTSKQLEAIKALAKKSEIYVIFPRKLGSLTIDTERKRGIKCCFVTIGINRYSTIICDELEFEVTRFGWKTVDTDFIPDLCLCIPRVNMNDPFKFTENKVESEQTQEGISPEMEESK